MRTEKPYVLLVDDNEAVCTLVTAVLQREYDIESVCDGSEALECLRVKNYGAILLDLRMPPPDGFDILDFLQEHRPEVLKTVLILTAAVSHADIERARSYGVCGIIAKPFEVETLLAFVRECVNPAETRSRGGIISSSVLLLLADLLKRQLL